MLVGACRVLVRLFAQFVSGQVIAFPVGGGGSSVGVGSKVVEFCGAIVRALWHGVLLAGWMLRWGSEATLKG